MDRSERRLLREAIRNNNLDRIRLLVAVRGLNINAPVSNVLADTPLIFCVKHGSLEIVEYIVGLPQCDINAQNRLRCTALAEAIAISFGGHDNQTKTKHDRSRYRRIVKKLLSAGATDVSPSNLAALIRSAVKDNYRSLQKLVEVFCERAHVRLRNDLFNELVRHEGTEQLVRSLLKHGAEPESLQFVCSAHQPPIPLANALLLIQCRNDSSLLQHIEAISCRTTLVKQRWNAYKTLLEYLVLCEQDLRLSVLHYIYVHQAHFYVWLLSYLRQPLRLDHLCRIAIRRRLNTNVFYALGKFVDLPERLLSFLLFS